jgi:hypothetical protein
MFEETKRRSTRTLVLATLSEGKETMFSDIFLACKTVATPDELKRILLQLELDKEIVETKANSYKIRKK